MVSDRTPHGEDSDKHDTANAPQVNFSSQSFTLFVPVPLLRHPEL